VRVSLTLKEFTIQYRFPSLFAIDMFRHFGLQILNLLVKKFIFDWEIAILNHFCQCCTKATCTTKCICSVLFHFSCAFLFYRCRPASLQEPILKKVIFSIDKISLFDYLQVVTFMLYVVNWTFVTRKYNNLCSL
jgi:hypothetical protein